MILKNTNRLVRVESELFGQTHFNKQNVNVACSPERLALLLPSSLACSSPGGAILGRIQIQGFRLSCQHLMSLKRDINIIFTRFIRPYETLI